MKWIACTGIMAALLAGFSQSVEAGAKVTVGRDVAAGGRVALDQVDHADWDALLQRYVNPQGNVAYAQWKASAADVAQLDRYLAQLSAGDPAAPSSQQAKLAFWINAYNAVTVRGILREYPTTSIRNHTAKLFGYNIWKDLLLPVAGTPYSLEQIEHQVLRKMNEPRIHFAIVCASRGCPRLLNQAYTAARVEQQLQANARQFFQTPGNFRYDASGSRFYLSSILSWFAEDFGATQAEQLRTIAPLLPTREAYDAAVGNRVTVSYLTYDWGLNDQGGGK